MTWRRHGPVAEFFASVSRLPHRRLEQGPAYWRAKEKRARGRAKYGG
jgi:hypothetical protein